MTRDRYEDDGTLCCLTCGWRLYGRAPMPLVREREGATTEVVGTLNKTGQMALRLFQEGMSASAIAKHLMMGKSTVQLHLAQARQMGLLKPWAPTDWAAMARYARMHGRQAAADQFKMSLRSVHRALKKGLKAEEERA